MILLSKEQVEDWLIGASKDAPIYMIGIGGSGMAGLAHLMVDLGFKVLGSDITDNTEIRQLRNRGVVISQGHEPEFLHTNRPELIVYSSAVRLDNPELAIASKLQIPIIRRAVLLAALAGSRRTVCVAGMHGKTTTSAMIAHSLDILNPESGFAIGAAVPQLGRHARVSSSDDAFFVVETDESDGTLSEFSPEQSILLNIDEEHLDYYENLDAICTEFVAFGKQTKGTLIYCADDPRLTDLFGNRPKSISYGFNPTSDYQVEVGAKGEFQVKRRGQVLGQFKIELLGEKNISNAVAAIAFLHSNGYAADEISYALRRFKGVNRRQQELFGDRSYRIFDDYGHHPREIEATISAIKEECSGRLLVAFQPHRFTRTKHLLSDFITCFKGADLLWVTEVYAASEAPMKDVNGRLLAQEISNNGQSAAYVATLDELRTKVSQALRPGDVILFMGAGDITQVAHQLATDLDMKETPHATELRELLDSESKVLENEPMARRTTIGVGGTADIYIEPSSELDLANILRYTAAHELPVTLLGRGSNLLIQDDGIRGVVVRLKHKSFNFIEISGDQIRCGAGARLNHIANAARDAGLAGMEFMEGIPGCLGGALRMNAGAWNGETFGRVVSVKFMTKDGYVKERPVNQMGAIYRSCPILGENIALEATLRGVLSEKSIVQEKMDCLRKQRIKSQPHYRSAGCMFKNPEGSSAGQLVDECNLKGLQVGGARVSEKHGNFIINSGNASAADVIDLMEKVKSKVSELKGVKLQTEVQIIGE